MGRRGGAGNGQEGGGGGSEDKEGEGDTVGALLRASRAPIICVMGCWARVAAAGRHMVSDDGEPHEAGEPSTKDH